MNMQLSTLSSRLPDFGAVIKRFPIAAAIMACVTLYLVIYGFDRFRGPRAFAIIGITLAAYLAMMQTLWAEARTRKLNWILQIIVAIAMATLFYHAKKLHLNVGMIVGAVLLLIGNSVRFGRGRDDVHVWDFTHKIWTAAGFAFAGSLIYYLGVMAIMVALKSLFGLNIEKLIEHLIMPIGLTFLAPLYWLSNVPPVDEPTEYLSDNPSFVSKAVAFLGTWILSPLTLIYAAILAAYAVKILLQMKLPNGEIAPLTTPFLLIGTLTWLLLEPPFIQKNTLARLFRKVWFILSVPAAIMLSVSVAVRVGEYGLTFDRILLMLACLWSLGLAAWFMFAPKAKRDIRIIPALAAGLFLAAAPVSHYLSNASQAARFEVALIQMKTAQKDDLKPAADAKGALYYLWRHDAKDKALNIIRGAGNEVSEKANLDEIHKTLDLTSVKPPRGYKANSETVRTVTYEYKNSSGVLAVSGYDYVGGDYYYSFAKNTTYTVLQLKDATIKMQNGVLVLFETDKEINNFDLREWLKSLPLENEMIIGADKPQIIYQDERRKLTLLVKSMGRNVTNNDIEKLSGNVRFYILSTGFEPKP